MKRSFWRMESFFNCDERGADKVLVYRRVRVRVSKQHHTLHLLFPTARKTSDSNLIPFLQVTTRLFVWVPHKYPLLILEVYRNISQETPPFHRLFQGLESGDNMSRLPRARASTLRTEHMHGA